MPGATPAQFQNAEIDTPGRSLRTWVNGTQPNSNATRIDGAVSVNIWLPHHVGYIQPAETIETVNISTNNFDAEYGMAGGAASTVITKSGTNNVRGSAFWFGNKDELNANTYFNNAFDLAKDRAHPQHLRRHGRRAGDAQQAVLLRIDRALRRSRGSLANYGVPTARMRNGDFSEVAAAYADFRLYNPFTGGAGGAGRELFPNITIPSSMISACRASVMGYFPLPNTTADLNSNQLPDDYQQFREVTLRSRQLRPEDDLAAQRLALGVGQVLDAGRGRDRQLLARLRRGQPRRHPRLRRRLGHTWTLSPTLVLDGNFGANIQNQAVTGPDYGDNLGLGLGIPGSNGPDIRQSGLPHFDAQHKPATTSARRRTGCRCSARSAATRSAPP